MPPRSNWKGYLKLSLVSCPVALFSAASATEKVSFHMLNAETGNRLKQQYVDAETGDVVERDERVKGYEIAKGDYVTVTDEELNEIEIESSHTIDIQSFAARSEVDPVYFDNSYYIAPDDKVGAEAFAVIREAMRVRDVVGIGRVVLYGRERIVMLEPRGEGILATSLRYAYEVRDDKAYFDDIPKDRNRQGDARSRAAYHRRQGGEIRSRDVQGRLSGGGRRSDPRQARGPSRARAPHGAAPSNVVNLMDALRRSLGPDGGKGGKAAGAKPRRGESEGRRAGACARPRRRWPRRGCERPADGRAFEDARSLSRQTRFRGDAASRAARAERRARRGSRRNRL